MKQNNTTKAAIDTNQNLHDAQAITIRTMIGMSALNIINAGIFANDMSECLKEARRTYKDCRGMYKRVRSHAIKVLRTAEEHGLTFEKPYKIMHFKDGQSMLCGVMQNGDFAPLIGIGPRK